MLPGYPELHINFKENPIPDGTEVLAAAVIEALGDPGGPDIPALPVAVAALTAHSDVAVLWLADGAEADQDIGLAVESARARLISRRAAIKQEIARSMPGSPKTAIQDAGPAEPQIMRVVESNVDGCGGEAEMYAEFERLDPDLASRFRDLLIASKKEHGRDDYDTEAFVQDALERFREETGIACGAASLPYGWEARF